MKKHHLIRTSITLALALGLVLLAGCGSGKASVPKDEKMVVSVTILPQKAFVDAVCGDLVKVVTLVPPGSSPESYEPTPMQMQEFSKSSVYFTIGVPVESASILPGVGSIKTVDLAAASAKSYPDRQFGEGERDPHIWLSPKRAKAMVQEIAAQMSALDEQNAGTYNDNAKAFTEQLDNLDNEISAMFSGVTKEKTFLTVHPAYGYFADDYGLEMYSLEEEDKEATPQHLQEMIDLAKAESIHTIFSQAEADSKQPDAFAEEIGGEKVMLDPLSEDYVNNLRSMATAISGAMQ